MGVREKLPSSRPKGWIVKKKGKEKKKKAAKSFASMMAKDLKEIMAKESDGSEAGSEEGEKGDEDDDSLFKLVRGEKAKGKKKRKVNFIVTLAGGGKDYVPSRWSSLMMTDQEGGDKFVPQRPRLADDSKASASEKRERSVSGEDLVVDKGWG